MFLKHNSGVFSINSNTNDTPDKYFSRYIHCYLNYSVVRL